MPENHAAKTESERKFRFAGLLLLLVVLAVVIAAGTVRTVNGDACRQTYRTDKMITLRNRHFRTEVVSDEASREKGLSGRSCIADDTAMLFEFPASGRYCFWMKDMAFPIDMVWLDQNHTIVHIKQNTQPDTYPQTFCPDLPAKYVIELKAGTTGNAELAEGDTVRQSPKSCC
jgi:uncharacterized membrane protein (UPF0127 family)